MDMIPSLQNNLYNFKKPLTCVCGGLLIDTSVTDADTDVYADSTVYTCQKCGRIYTTT